MTEVFTTVIFTAIGATSCMCDDDVPKGLRTNRPQVVDDFPHDLALAIKLGLSWD